MKTIKYISSVIILLFAIGCQQAPSDEHAHEEEAHEHGDESENKEEVHMVQKQMDVMGIELGKFQDLNLSTTVKANGQLELPPQNKASLSAILGGRIKSVKVLEGDYVNKGQTLATMEHPSFIELQQQYMTSASNLAFLEQEYQRKKTLFSDSISSEKMAQQAEAKYIAAKAQTNGLKAKLQLLDIDVTSVKNGNFIKTIPVKSPISGYIKRIEINIGKYVQAEEEMFEIVDNKHIHIDLMVYEKDMNKVKEGQKVIFSLSNDPDLIFQGSIFATGKSFMKEPKAMVAHAEIDNKTGNLLPGMYVDARIVTNEKTVRAIPNDAIVSDNGLNYIFVLKPGSVSQHSHDDKAAHDENEAHSNEYVYRKIEVNTGATDIGFTEVIPTYNLPDHIQIVTKGAFYLLAEMKKGEGGHGHHH